MSHRPPPVLFHRDDNIDPPHGTCKLLKKTRFEAFFHCALRELKLHSLDAGSSFLSFERPMSTSAQYIQTTKFRTAA